MSYDLGDRVKVYTSTPFATAAGVDIDPTTVTITIKTPAGVSTAYVYITDPEVVRVTTGDYYMLLNASQEGEWPYRIAGLDALGNYMGADEGSFMVHQSEV